MIPSCSPLLVGSRISVGVGNKGVAGVDEVGLGSSHQLGAGDLDDLAVLPVLGGVSQRQQDTTGRPGELVAQGVIRSLGGRKATAVAEEALDLSAGLVNLVNGLDGVQVVQTGVKTNLVHDRDTSVLALLVQLHHGRGDVAGGDDMLLLADGRLDDGGVEGVGNQADDKVVLGHLGVQGLVVGHIEGDGGSILDTGGERLGRLEGSASCGSLILAIYHTRRPRDVLRRGRECLPTVTGIPASDRISSVGLVTKPAPSINTLHREPWSA